MYSTYQNRISTRLNITPGGYFAMGLVCMSLAALMGI
jgi:hypothetical protein